MVSGDDAQEEQDPDKEAGEVKEMTDEEKRKENLKKLLESSRIDIQEPGDDDIPTDGVIDVSAAFLNSSRTLYSRNAKKTKAKHISLQIRSGVTVLITGDMSNS